MKFEIKDQLNYINEEFSILNILTREEEFLKSTEGLLHYCRSRSHTQIIQRYEMVMQIINRAKKELSPRLEQVSQYFSNFPNTELCLADMIFLHFPWEENLQAETIGTFTASFSSQERDWRLAQLCAPSEDDIPADPKQSFTLEQINACFAQLDASPEAKWQLLQGYLNWSQHLSAVIPLLKTAEKVLLDTKELWQPILEDFKLYWTDKAAQRDIISDIRDIYHIDIYQSKNSQNLCVSPRLIAFNSLGFFAVPYDFLPFPNYISIGVVFCDDFYFDTPLDKKAIEKRALQTLKLLADKSKFDILTSIKDKDAYGAELSRKTGLTTATISYHMTALLQEQLIHVERVNNRIYYRLNRDSVKELIEFLQETLL